MTNKDRDRIIEENKESIVEIIEFWTWMRGLNKLAKWIVLVGAPITVAAWAAYNWIKKH